MKLHMYVYMYVCDLVVIIIYTSTLLGIFYCPYDQGCGNIEPTTGHFDHGGKHCIVISIII